MHKLLQRCIAEQQRLCWSTNPLAKELDHLTPPILWFGQLFPSGSSAITDFDRENLNGNNTIITIGANPSWLEYHSSKGALTLLPHNKQRLKLMSDKIAEILKGYNEYFNSNSNPYTKWFGSVEHFLNGMGASYYGTKSMRAVHIDLFPFATRSDYTDISDMVHPMLMMTGFAQRHLHELIDAIRPKRMVAFGKSTYEALRMFYDPTLPDIASAPHTFTNSKGTRSYKWINTKLYGRDLVALTCNLGNPIGLTNNLNRLGGIV